MAVDEAFQLRTSQNENLHRRMVGTSNVNKMGKTHSGYRSRNMAGGTRVDPRRLFPKKMVAVIKLERFTDNGKIYGNFSTFIFFGKSPLGTYPFCDQHG